MKCKLLLLSLVLASAVTSFGQQAMQDFHVVAPYQLCFGGYSGDAACFKKSSANTVDLTGTLTVNGTAVGSGSGLTITTVSGLATVSGKTKGTIAVVTDGNSATDCTTGTGTTVVTCQYSGSTWAAFASNYTLPTATSSVLGGVKPDGTSILNTAGVISASAASVGAIATGAAPVGAIVGTTDAQTLSGKTLLTPSTTYTASCTLDLAAGTGKCLGPVVRMNVTTTANTITVPPHSSVAFPLGTCITVRQVGTGTTTIVGNGVSGVTITTPSSYVLRVQQASVQLCQTDTQDTWDLYGDTQ